MGYIVPLAKPVMGMPEKENLVKCITDGWVSSGSFVADFEDQMAAVCHRDYACSTSSGTAALHLALEALGVQGGDKVVVPTLTYIATVNAILQCGATPVFVDSRESDWQMDEDQVEEALKDRDVVAVVAVHLYGAPCDIVALEWMCETNNVILIEDCAEALGSGVHGRPVGSFGDASIFSFYGNKNITTGEGGMVLCEDAALWTELNHIKNHSTVFGKGYSHDKMGYNYRMSNLHAAVGCAQMGRLEGILERKEEICNLYTSTIFRPIAKGEIRSGWVETWKLRGRGVKAGRWLYSLVLGTEKLRDGLIDHLKEKDIESRPFFTPCHLMPHVGVHDVFPVAEDLSKRGINLPTYPEMTDLEVKYVSSEIIDFLRHNVT